MSFGNITSTSKTLQVAFVWWTVFLDSGDKNTSQLNHHFHSLFLGSSLVKWGSGSLQDPARILVGIEILAAGIFIPGGNPGGIAARFLPETQIPGGQNLGGILPGISPRLMPGSKNPGGQNLSVILLGISPRFAVGSEILGKIHCRNLGKILVTGNFFPRRWISFEAIIF